MPPVSRLALDVRDLACNRGGRGIFRDLSFRLEQGHALVVTGANGAGKSSLLRLVAGLVPVASGTVALEGGNPDLDLFRQCHYFGHQDALKNALNVRENLEFWRSYNGATGLDAEAALDAVGLGHLAHLSAGWLSAGQRRRLSLARLLVSHRPVWLLDEPSSALDMASEARLCDLVNAHLAAGGLAVIATHSPLAIAPRASLRIGAAAEAA